MLEVTEQIQLIFLLPVFMQLCATEILTEKKEFFLKIINNIIL